MLLVLVMCFKGVSSQTVSLTVDPSMPVTEGDRVHFTCRTTGSSRAVSFIRSDENENEVIVSWITENSMCFVLHPRNISLYNASCDGPNSQYFMDILNVSSGFHHYKIKCSLQYGNTSIEKVEGFVSMEVNVPLKYVTLDVNKNITLQESNTAVTSCTARSRPTPDFTWFISERQIYNNYTVTTYNDIIVTSTVRFTGNRGDNNGRLYCKANNGITEVTSCSSFLNITYSPNISVTYSLKPIEGTKQFNLTCIILDSNPTVNNFSWYVNADLSLQSHYIMTFNNLNRTDSNNYTCQATNGIGDPTNATILIDVLYKSTILKFANSNISMMEGDIFNAYVDAEGHPAPNVTWFSSRTNVIIWMENQVLRSTLNITTKCEDTGDYTCAVDNGLSSPDTVHFRITVFCKARPNHHTSNENKQLTAGETLRLNATFVAFPPPNITWYFKRNSSQMIQHLTALTHTVSDESIHVSSLTILKSNSSHTGLYTIMAENSLGQATIVYSVNIIDANSKEESNFEAVIATFAGGFVSVCLVAIFVICYRKKIMRENRRNQPRRTSSSPEDIYNTIDENCMDGVEKPSGYPMQLRHLITSLCDNSKSHTATTKEPSNVYANVNTSNAYTNVNIDKFQTNDYVSYVNTSIQ